MRRFAQATDMERGRSSRLNQRRDGPQQCDQQQHSGNQSVHVIPTVLSAQVRKAYQFTGAGSKQAVAETRASPATRSTFGTNQRIEPARSGATGAGQRQ